VAASRASSEGLAARAGVVASAASALPLGDVVETDVTEAFAATAAAWLAETEPYAEELARLEPPGAFEQRQADRRRMLAAIHAGLLRRALVLARTRRREGYTPLP
jgi:hypothetical protein